MIIEASGPEAYYSIKRPLELPHKLDASAATLPCALENTTIAFAVRQSPPEAPLGSGHLDLRVVVKAVDDKQLSREHRGYETEVARGRAERSADAERACAACRPEWLACVARKATITGSQCQPYRSCLANKRSRITPRECGH